MTLGLPNRLQWEEVRYCTKKKSMLLLAASRPWQLTGIVRALKCSIQHVNVGGDFLGIHLWRCRAHQMEICAVLRVVNRKSLYRHDNAMHLRRNGVNQVPEPHSNIIFSPCKSKESLSFSLSHVMILVSGTGYDRNRGFGALIRPLITRCGMTVAWYFPSFRCNSNQ